MLWPGTGPVWVMGCGNMGGALLERWLEAGLAAKRVHVIDPAPARIASVAWGTEPPHGQPDLIVLGVKPQMLEPAAATLAQHIDDQTTLLSMLAGVEAASLRAAFPSAKAIIRAMPNLPVRLGKGVTGLFSADADASTRGAIDALFAPTGQAEWLGDELLFHAITALSGSGPAFVYRFIAALAKGGSALGLPSDQSLRLAQAMVEGAAALSIASGESPDELARQVTSPNGTTAAGLAVQDADGQFARIVGATLAAAAGRSKELAEAAR
jgi:pyrroline-5-carboxylate reductase